MPNFIIKKSEEEGLYEYGEIREAQGVDEKSVRILGEKTLLSMQDIDNKIKDLEVKLAHWKEVKEEAEKC